MVNNVDPDQTLGAVRSGSALFAQSCPPQMNFYGMQVVKGITQIGSEKEFRCS